MLVYIWVTICVIVLATIVWISHKQIKHNQKLIREISDILDSED